MKEFIESCEKGLLENLAFIGNIAVPIIALIAGGIAIFQIISSANSQRRSTAYALYAKYLSLAMENHKFAYGVESEIRENVNDYAKYKWFVATMLLCFEEILISCPKESDWIETINAQLRRHSWHLSKSSSIRNGHWKRPLKILIEVQISIFENTQFASRDLPKTTKEICFKLSS
jgi:hypothetical protein